MNKPICPPAQFHTSANQYEEGHGKKKAKDGGGAEVPIRASGLHRKTNKASIGRKAALGLRHMACLMLRRCLRSLRLRSVQVARTVMSPMRQLLAFVKRYTDGKTD